MTETYKGSKTKDNTWDQGFKANSKTEKYINNDVLYFKAGLSSFEEVGIGKTKEGLLLY